MVWCSAESESLNGTDLSENPVREIGELLQGLQPCRRAEKSGCVLEVWGRESGMKRGLFLCMLFCVFKMYEIIA